MRKQTEFRTYPPINGSAGWGAGNKDDKNGNERQPSAQPAALAFDFGDGRTVALLLACCWRRRRPFPPRAKMSGPRSVRRCNGC
jgi:hypothetical protein